MAHTAVETHEPSAAVARATAGPEKLMQFLRDTRTEMRKVVTPTREEVQTGTLVVVVTVFIFAAYFEVVDLILGRGIDKLFVWATHHH